MFETRQRIQGKERHHDQKAEGTEPRTGNRLRRALRRARRHGDRRGPAGQTGPIREQRGQASGEDGTASRCDSRAGELAAGPDCGRHRVDGEPGQHGGLARVVQHGPVRPSTQGGKDFSAGCPGGAKAVSGGYASPNTVLALDTRPTADGGGWTVYLANGSDTQSATGSVQVICIR
jgi:hypothetical protein